jgi:chromosome segregation ATPase
MVVLCSAQIERMQGDMDAVHNNMAQSERKLRGIESVWGALFNTVTSGNNRAHKKKASADRAAMKERKKGDERAHKAQVKDWEKDRSATRANAKKRDNMIRPTASSRAQMGQSEEKFYEYTDDTDRTLDAMDSLLDDLKGTALNMNTELDVQNKRLDILHRDVSTAQPRIEKAIGRCGAIVK